jgi:hypothetical protein
MEIAIFDSLRVSTDQIENHVQDIVNFIHGWTKNKKSKFFEENSKKQLNLSTTTNRLNYTLTRKDLPHQVCTDIRLLKN